MFIHGGCNIRRTNCFEKQIKSIKLYHLNYKDQNTLLLLLLLVFIINIFHVKERLRLNNDRHQYQQNEQPSLTSNI